MTWHIVVVGRFECRPAASLHNAWFSHHLADNWKFGTLTVVIK